MPSRLATIGLLLLAGSSLALPALGSEEAGAAASRTALQRLDELARDPQIGIAEVFGAAGRLGLDPGPSEPLPQVPRVTTEPPGFSLVSIDLVLSQLALQTGANYHVALRRAQARPEVLIIESGATTLSGLFEAVTAAGLEGVLTRTDDGIVAHLPIALWTGATLSLAPGETLLLDRARGAFLLSAGRLAADGARIASHGGPNPRLADFTPFVVIALSGSAAIADTEFSQLGFGGRPPMGGVTLISGGLFPATAASFVHGSRFLSTGTLSVVGGHDVVIADNRFTATRGTSLLVSGGTGVRLLHNLVVAPQGSHGIKITAAAAATEVRGNIVLDSDANGLFAEAGVDGLGIVGNLVAGSALSGVSLAAAGCSTVTGNLLAANRHSGLAIRASAGAFVQDNSIAGNAGAGIAVSAQPLGSTVILEGNRLDGNKVGIRGSNTGRMVLAGNDLRAQTPRLLDGELVQYAARFFALAASGDALTIDGLVSPSVAVTPAAARDCQFPEGA